MNNRYVYHKVAKEKACSTLSTMLLPKRYCRRSVLTAYGLIEYGTALYAAITLDVKFG